METYSGHVKTPQDAIVLFEACRLGLLPRVQRRLSEKERQLIKSGSVFVWDEREAGMRRWTDGKSWSASRVNGSFLTYREMEGKRTTGSNNGYTNSPGKDNGNGDDSHSGDAPDGYRYKPDGLTKQSFSITTSQGQHLHLISYFSRSHASSGSLSQPSSDPALRHVRPERGMYPESTLQDHNNTPALTRSPMTNLGSRYATDGSPNQIHSTASTPQYAQPRHYNPYQNRQDYGQAQAHHWPPSPMHTPPINGVGSHASPRYANSIASGPNSGGLSYTSSILHHSAPLSHSTYPPNHHREVGSSTAFDRLPTQISSTTALPPPPNIPAPAYTNGYPPPPPSAYSAAPPYPTVTSTPAPYSYAAPTSHPSSHYTPLSSAGPTPPEVNTLAPFRRNPSPLHGRSDSGTSSIKDVIDREHRTTPPVTELPSIADRDRESPHTNNANEKRGTIPSIDNLISQTPPPDYGVKESLRERRSPPNSQGPTSQPYTNGYVGTSPYQSHQRHGSGMGTTPPRPGLGSRGGSFHGVEADGRGRSSGDKDVLRKLDGAFAASR